MKVQFYSKSANPDFVKADRKKKKHGDIVKKFFVHSEPKVYWFGDVDTEIMYHGSDFGFVCEKYKSGKMPSLISAKAMVFNRVDPYKFSHAINVMNFCVDHDVPIFWLDKWVYPDQFMFHFKKVFIGNVDYKLFWKEVVLCLI